LQATADQDGHSPTNTVPTTRSLRFAIFWEFSQNSTKTTTKLENSSERYVF